MSELIKAITLKGKEYDLMKDEGRKFLLPKAGGKEIDTFQAHFPISTFGAPPKQWVPVFENVGGQNITTGFKNEKYGEIGIIKWAESVIIDGELCPVLESYEGVLVKDGPVDKTTGHVEKPNALCVIVIKRNGKFFFVAHKEKRGIIKHPVTGKWGQLGEPVVAFNFAGGWAKPDQSSLQSALDELEQEEGLRINSTQNVQHAGCICPNRASYESVVNVYWAVVEAMPEAVKDRMSDGSHDEIVSSVELISFSEFDPEPDGLIQAAAHMIIKKLGCISDVPIDVLKAQVREEVLREWLEKKISGK